MTQPDKAQRHDQHHQGHDGPQGHLSGHRETGGQQGHHTGTQILHPAENGPRGAGLTRERLDGAGGGGRVENTATDEVDSRTTNQRGGTHHPEQPRHQNDEGAERQKGDPQTHQLALSQTEAQLGREPGPEQIAGQRQHEQHAHGTGAQFQHIAQQHTGRSLEHSQTGKGRHQAKQVALKLGVAQHMTIGSTDAQRLTSSSRQRLTKPGHDRQSGYGTKTEQEPVTGAPVEQLGQPATQHRGQQRGEDHPHAHQTVGAVELGAVVAIAHHGTAHGATGTGTQPLNKATH